MKKGNIQQFLEEHSGFDIGSDFEKIKDLSIIQTAEFTYPSKEEYQSYGGRIKVKFLNPEIAILIEAITSCKSFIFELDGEELVIDDE